MAKDYVAANLEAPILDHLFPNMIEADKKAPWACNHECAMPASRGEADLRKQLRNLALRPTAEATNKERPND